MADLPSYYQDVMDVMKPIIRAVWVPILLAESGGNASAYHGPNTAVWGGNFSATEESAGLFQLNRMGGQGSGYEVETLMNPITNASIARKSIFPAYQRAIEAAGGIGAFPDIIAISIESGHPGPVPRNDARVLHIQSIYQAILNAEKGKGGFAALTDAELWSVAMAAHRARARGSPDFPAPGGAVGEVIEEGGEQVGENLIGPLKKWAEESAVNLALVTIAVLLLVAAVFAILMGAKGQAAAAVTGA